MVGQLYPKSAFRHDFPPAKEGKIMAKKKVVNLLNVTVNSSTKAPKQPKDRKPYDDRKVKPGEVLVPMMATKDRIRTLGANTANIYTWKNAGRVYQVMFYPVPKSTKKIAMQQFATELNEFLGKNRDARCLTPQDDGSVKVCPKKNGDNRCACVDCPHNSAYDREDKTIDSLDAMLEVGYEPKPTRSAEDEFMFGELFDELMQELREKYPREEQIVTMLLDDEEKKAIFEKLKLKKSQGYNVLAQANKLVEKILRS